MGWCAQDVREDTAPPDVDESMREPDKSQSGNAICSKAGVCGKVAESAWECRGKRWPGNGACLGG